MAVADAVVVGRRHCLCGHGHDPSCRFCCACGRRGEDMAEAADAEQMAFEGGEVAKTGGYRSMNFKLKLKQA